MRGEIRATENAPLDRVWIAVSQAMNDLPFAITRRVKEARSAELIARSTRGKKIRITLTAVTDNTTAVSIRVGTFGDEALSLLIYDKIKQSF